MPLSTQDLSGLTQLTVLGGLDMKCHSYSVYQRKISNEKGNSGLVFFSVSVFSPMNAHGSLQPLPPPATSPRNQTLDAVLSPRLVSRLMIQLPIYRNIKEHGSLMQTQIYPRTKL